MTVNNDAELLRDMVALIERDGWWNGSDDRFKNGGYKQCVVTAFNVVSRSGMCDDAVLERLMKTLGVKEIAPWNDAQANGQVVIERLLEIADKWEAEDSWAVTAVEE